MIPNGTRLGAAWVNPDDLLVDHREHGIGLESGKLSALISWLRAHPEGSTDPVVAERRNGRLWITNGRHRTLAHQLLKRERIAVVVVSEELP